MEEAHLVWPPRDPKTDHAMNLNATDIDGDGPNREGSPNTLLRSSSYSSLDAALMKSSKKVQPIETLQTASREELLTTIMALREEKFQVIFEQEELFKRIEVLTRECMTLKNKNLDLEQENRKHVAKIASYAASRPAEVSNNREKANYSEDIKQSEAAKANIKPDSNAHSEVKKIYHVVESKSKSPTKIGRRASSSKSNQQQQQQFRPGGILGDLDKKFPPVSEIKCDAMEQTFVSGIDAKEVRPLSAMRNFVRRLSQHKTGPGSLIEGFQASDVIHEKEARATTLAVASAAVEAANAAAENRASPIPNDQTPRSISNKELSTIRESPNGTSPQPEKQPSASTMGSFNERKSGFRWSRRERNQAAAS
jgi:hypothetical protein